MSSTNNNNDGWLSNYYRVRDNLKGEKFRARFKRFFEGSLDENKTGYLVSNALWCSKYFSDNPQLYSEAVEEANHKYIAMGGTIKNSNSKNVTTASDTTN